MATPPSKPGSRRLHRLFDDVSIFADREPSLARSNSSEDLNIRPFTDREASILARLLWLCIVSRRPSSNIGRKNIPVLTF